MLPVFLENGNGLHRGALENYELVMKFYLSFVRPAHLYILHGFLPHGIFHLISTTTLRGGQGRQYRSHPTD